MGAVYDAPMELKSRILKARNDAGLTQEQLAAVTGKTRSAVAQWESGESTPRWNTLNQIAAATGTKAAWLIYEEDVGLRVVGEIAVGIWRESEVAFREYIGPVAAHPRYPASAQRVWKVNDQSIETIAVRGSFLHGIDLQSARIAAQDGELVVVRRRDQSKNEYTARFLVTVNGRQMLRIDGASDWLIDAKVDMLDLVIGKWEPLTGRRGLNSFEAPTLLTP
jgi:transcriptional regulator with XRE-family HTH domain